MQASSRPSSHQPWLRTKSLMAIIITVSRGSACLLPANTPATWGTT
jgi:hypothetical protein